MNTRQALILEWLSRERQLSIKVLAEHFQVSDMTIYRDVYALCAQNLVVRTLGGIALPTSPSDHSPSVDEGEDPPYVRWVLGQYAAKYISAGQTVIFDAGNTVLEVARALPADLTLTAVTTSLPVAGILGEKPAIAVIVAGGQYQRADGAVQGPLAIAFFEQIHADVLVMSAASVDPERGMGSDSIEEAAIQRAMMAHAHRIILVCTATQFSRPAFITTAPLTAVDLVISDDRLPEDIRQKMSRRAIGWEVVPCSPALLATQGVDLWGMTDHTS